MGFNSLLYVHKMNLEYLSLPFVIRILYNFFMFYFLSTSETNWIFKKINQIKNQSNVVILCSSSQCVTGENGGCALSGAQTIKHVATCCKSCHTSQYLKVNSISAAIDPSEVLVFKLTDWPHSLPRGGRFSENQGCGRFSVFSLCFCTLVVRAKPPVSLLLDLNAKAVYATGWTKSISTVYTTYAEKHQWVFLPIHNTTKYVQDPS